MASFNRQNNSREVQGSVYLTAEDNIVLVDTRTQTCNIVLPLLSTSGLFANQVIFKVVIIDYYSNAGTYNITITPSTGNQINNASSLVLSTDGGQGQLIITSPIDYAFLSTANSTSSTISGYVTISSAEILSLNTVVKEIIPAQGAGKVTKLTSFVSKFTYAATAYSSAANIDFYYGATDSTKIAITNALLVASANKIYDGSGGALTAINTTPTYANYANAAVNLKATGAITLGDGTISCYYEATVMTI